MIITLLRFIWIGCCAVAMVLQTLLLLGEPFSAHVPIIGLIWSATVFGYQFLRTERWLRRMAYLAGACAFGFLLFLPRQTALQMAAPAAIWVLYYFAGEQSLRRLRFLKPVSIAFVWAWVTVWLPLDIQQWPTAFLIFICRAIFIFVLALAYDLSDLHYDRQRHLSTLVQHWGAKKTFLWIDRLLICAALVCMLNYLCKIYSLEAMCVLLLSLVFTAWWLRLIQRRVDSSDWQKWMIDTSMMVQCLSVALVLPA